MAGGTIVTQAGEPLPDRLRQIYDGLCRYVAEFQPDAVAVEELFFATNAKTAMVVAQGRGVAVLAAGSTGRPVFEYTPLQVKQAVTGSGRADKAQIRKMVRMLLGLGGQRAAESESAVHAAMTDHEADALAIALCHAHSAGMQSKLNAALLAAGKPAIRGRGTRRTKLR